MGRSKLTTAGVLAGIVFAVGFVVIVMIPGLGGTSTTKEFQNFYNSNGQRTAATFLSFALISGCWLMVWLFSELRSSLPSSTRSNLAFHLSLVGAAAVMIGCMVELGPTMVQSGDDNADFVGITIAHTFTQAGAAAVIAGMFTFAAAVMLNGLEIRRSRVLPGWLGATSVVVAVLLISSLFVLPGFLLSIWAILVGVAGRKVGGRASSPDRVDGHSMRHAEPVG